MVGCASASEDDAAAVAAAVEDARTAPQDRCDLLAPATRSALEEEAGAACADAIGGLPLPGGEVTSVTVWGDDAQARVGSDVVFLSETGAGWRVTAAGCEPRAQGPYDCAVEGP